MLQHPNSVFVWDRSELLSFEALNNVSSIICKELTLCSDKPLILLLPDLAGVARDVMNAYKKPYKGGLMEGI